MQCNQPFCGNGFSNGPYYNFNNNTPFQCSPSMYPEIVGEGEVTSVTLPDGNIQFFFMPTVKWWAPNTSPYHPNVPHPMHTNINCNPSSWNNNNTGSWLVRSISNPYTPNQNTFSPQCQPQRCEVPKLYYNSDCNMNISNNNGFQLKFHNDNWTSTTDIQYFYPCLRQRDYVLKQSCKGTAAVQVQTLPVANNTVCHYEVICSQPCKCNATTASKPMSLVSLVESMSNTKTNPGSTKCSCDDLRKKRYKREKRDKIRSKKSKNVVCACESTDKILTADKSVTTYKDIGSSCSPAGGRETQTCGIAKSQSCGIPKLQSCGIPKSQSCGTPKSQSRYNKEEPENCCSKSIPIYMADSVVQRCEVKKAETWHPITPQSKRAMKNSSEKLINISDNDYNVGCSSNCSCCSG